MEITVGEVGDLKHIKQIVQDAMAQWVVQPGFELRESDSQACGFKYDILHNILSDGTQIETEI